MGKDVCPIQAGENQVEILDISKNMYQIFSITKRDCPKM